MYLMYVDESGDPGRYNGKNTPHFILSGLIVPMEEWHLALGHITAFREEVKQRTGLAKREEIHSFELIRPTRQQVYKSIHKAARVQLLRDFVENIPAFFPNAHLLNVCFDKQQWPTTTDFMVPAWERLLLGFEQYLVSRQAPGVVVGDDTAANSLRALMRTLRKGSTPLRFLVEDVFHTSSQHSYFVQVADAVTYCLYRQEYPKGSARKFNLHQLFAKLEGMCLKTAAPTDAQGIIRD